MGAVVLVTLALVEIIMLAASMITKTSKQKWLQVRTIVSVCEAFALALLMALHVSNMDFDFRWMALLAILSLRAVISLIVFLVRRNKASANVPQRTSKMVLNVIGSILVIAVATVPALVFPPYEGLPTTGEYAVNEAHAIMVDATRMDSFEQDGSHREIPVWLYYPDAPNAESNTFPLVIFSHGAFGYHESNYSLCTELASHGYVVAALDYPHHAFFSTDTQGNTVIVDGDFINQAIAAQNGELSNEESYALEQDWMNLRMADLGFTLDTIEAAVRNGSVNGEAWFFDSADQEAQMLKALQLVNVDKIGLVGHSMGGATSVGQGRARNEVDAVIDLDGTMFTEHTLNNDGTYSYNEAPYPAPLLSIDNESHYQSGLQAKEQGYPYVNNVVLDNATVSAHTYFKGSGHMNFTDLPLFSPMLASMLGTGDIDARACIEKTNTLVLAWFDEHLKGSGQASVAESY